MQALYRRYRPDTFEEVIGQDAVVRALQNALKNNRIGHAYLFSGPRGCGKTTSARIFARCLNCHEGPTPTPCGKCPSCIDLATGAAGSVDVIEIDAASHNKVENARDLITRLEYAPTRDRFKIVILDEAHMITDSGFNALLKVVEEPPEHVHFIFATTEPNAVKQTIRSRTYHYAFRLVPASIIIDLLKNIAKEENMKVDENVFPLIARAGKGSVRDTLSVCDQLFAASTNSEISVELASNLLGFTSSEMITQFITGLIERDPAKMFDVIEKTTTSGVEPVQFLSDILENVRISVFIALMSASTLKNNSAQIKATFADVTEKELVILADLAEKLQNELLIKIADIILDGINSIKGVVLPSIQLEIVVAKISSAFTEQIQLERRLSGQSQQTVQQAPASSIPQKSQETNPAPAQSPKAAPTKKPENSIQPPVQNNAPQTSAPVQNEAPQSNAAVKESPEIGDAWQKLKEELKGSSKAAATLLDKHASVISAVNGVLVIEFNDALFLKTATDSGYLPKIESAAATAFGSPFRVTAISKGETPQPTIEPKQVSKPDAPQTKQVPQETVTEFDVASDDDEVAIIETAEDMFDDVFGSA